MGRLKAPHSSKFSTFFRNFPVSPCARDVETDESPAGDPVIRFSKESSANGL